ncbi:MAG: Rossmann-like and DUF2520 domain-containing protein [Candidatus Thermochlorobacter sp.]
MMTHHSSIQHSHFRVTLVGTGALGTSLARELVAKGYKFLALINRTLSDAETLAKELDIAIASDNLEHIPQETNLLLLAINDAAITSVSERIATLKLGFKNLAVVHFSGALTDEALKPLAEKQAITIALHPFQTFTRHSKQNLSERFKCYFGLQATELEGVEVGKKIAHDLGGKVMLIPKDAKTLYHIAGVMVSNYLVTLTSLATEVFAGLGLKPDEAFKVFEPIMHSTLLNMRESNDVREALSGPIERGDAATLRRHLRELSEQLPHIVPVYVALAIETVRVAIHKGSISQSEAAEILDALETFAKREASA